MSLSLQRLLHSDRDPIMDVPAVYFISPTQENIERLCQVICQIPILACFYVLLNPDFYSKDLKNDLYESYYLNFIQPIPRSQLEDIAQASIEANCVGQIQKVSSLIRMNEASIQVLIDHATQFFPFFSRRYTTNI